MAIIFITGSTDGLGRAAAQSLLQDGHKVVLHARSGDRAATIGQLASRAAGIVVGDLRSAAQTRSIADQVNAIGRMDAVIHNAGVYAQQSRGSTPEGHASTLAINTLAPYMLTALIEPPGRLVYLSSGLHRGGEGSLDDLDWTKRKWDSAKAYAESKLHVVALAYALAPVDVETGQRTQSWLAVSQDSTALVSGRYWHHLRHEEPAVRATDPEFQDELIAKLSELTGVSLPSAYPASRTSPD
jgi:NAD(P)-dependent dehydrogenase (short-subunit alcohol dehydrogenase family)